MNNICIQRPFFFCVFFVLLHLITAADDPPYTPTETIFLNCGSSEDGETKDGRRWTGDIHSKFGPIEPFPNKSIAAESIKQSTTVDSIPYTTARISRSEFTYTFPVTAGQKFIRLYFYPALYDHSGYDKYRDFFDVKAGHFTLLRNFSASYYAEFGWGVETFFKEFIVNVEENQQQLNLTFSPFLRHSNKSYAFINGIEIVSMPTGLYYTPPGDLGPKFVRQNAHFPILNNTALGKMCTVNIGGNTLPTESDTGMFRLWTDDTDYFWYLNGVIPRIPDIHLNYSKIPPYTAPADVYTSARSLQGRNATENLSANLTFGVTVDNDFMYFVRLHFCEIVPEIAAVNERVFSISIDGQEVESGVDVFKLSGGRGIPIYRDYIVTAGTGVNDFYVLLIILRPNASSLYDNIIINGLEVYKLNRSDGSLAGPNIQPPPFSPPPAVAPVQHPPTVNKSNTKKILLIASIGGGVTCLLIILSLMCCFVIWRQKKKKHYGSYYESLASCCWCLDSNKGKSTRTKASSLPDELCRHFSLDEIKTATDNFDENLIVGKGGFGKVYKGEIDDGAKVVAIKRLDTESRQGFSEFKNEIEMLSQLRHVHLVSLIGYCNDEGEMILVYDYMENGTLQDHLYGKKFNNVRLSWKQRLEICTGAARGLDYLHTGVTNTIIHRDVKTTNILLDEKWIAKVSDFGLSKTGMSDVAITTFVKGTPGYLDPEYARRNQLTDKSDVYSFGVVLFEVLCARKPVDRSLPDEQWSLANWARKCIQNGTIHQMIDSSLVGRIAPECFNKFVEVANSCLRDHGNDRPTMHDVAEELEFALELQVTADAEKEGKNPDGEYVYPEISFQPSAYTKVVRVSEMDSSNVSGFSSEDAGFTTSRSIDSDKHDTITAA